MIGLDIAELVAKNVVNSEEKWEARKSGREPDIIPKTEAPNYLRGIPNDWCQILKQQYGICNICRNSIKNEFHMSTVHKIEILDCKEIWTSIKDFHNETVERQRKKNRIMKVKRSVYLNYWGSRLRNIKEDTKVKFDALCPKPIVK